MSRFPLTLFSAGVPVSTGAGSITGLLLFVLIALFFSFLCSVLEAVLLASSASHIEMMVQRGSRAGELMQEHKAHVERPISAILTLNTIALTVGATGAGAQAVSVFGSGSIGLLSAVLTLLILVFSKMIPRTIGAVYWRQLLPVAAYVIRWLVVVLYPVVWLFAAMTRLRHPEGESPAVTRLELEALSKISLQEGALAEREDRIVRNLLHLHAVSVETIMTPRTVLMAVPEDLTVQGFVERYPSIAFSRIPLYGDSIDDVAGYALRYEILEHMAADDYATRLAELCHEMHAVPETANVGQVMDEFIQRKEHAFLVVDEYGGTAGIVTLEDIIEELVGDITDEYEEIPPESVRKIDEQTIEVDARTYVEDLNDEYELDLPEDEDYDTVGGFVFSRLGYVPKAGEDFDYENLKFTIASAEPRRVKRVRIQKVAK